MIRNTLLVAATVAVTLFVLEGLTRGLAALGYVELSFTGGELTRFRSDWHHARPGSAPALDNWRLPDGCPAPRLRILLAGDSWMQEPAFGLSLLHELVDGPEPHMLGDDPLGDRPCVQLVNIGTGSYAPSAISLRVRSTLEWYQPDLVIVHIDETDLMDEWIRYKPGLCIDERGLPKSATPSKADWPDMFYAVALDVMAGWPSYLARLAGLAVVRGLVLPRIRDAIARHGELATYATIMAPQRSWRAWEEYADEIRWFEQRLEAMITLIEGKAPEAKIVLLSHPHAPHLEGNPKIVYRFSVAEVLRRFSEKRNITYVDARQHLDEIYGPSRAGVFQWPADPFSHLTPDAARRYGSWVGKEVIRITTIGERPIGMSEPMESSTR